jgi:hypothetical protein
MQALDQLKSIKKEAAMRGKSPEDLVPFWERRKNV